MNKDKALTVLGWVICAIFLGLMWIGCWINTGSLLWGWLAFPAIIVAAIVLIWAATKVADSLL